MRGRGADPGDGVLWILPDDHLEVVMAGAWPGQRATGIGRPPGHGSVAVVDAGSGATGLPLGERQESKKYGQMVMLGRNQRKGQELRRCR